MERDGGRCDARKARSLKEVRVAMCERERERENGGGEVASPAHKERNARAVVGEVSISGNIICPLCQRWTGQNAQIDNPPYSCPHCKIYIELLHRQERYYKRCELYEDF